MRRKIFFITVLAAVLGSTALRAAESERPTNRTRSLQAVCQRLGIGPGAVIADVGCGYGPDTLIFADIVGARGTVLAQEIDASKLAKVLEVTTQHGFPQVVPVLGQSQDPRLPDGFADLVYMNLVFHHFAQPQAMLERLWFDLKPGGFLVIVDREKGPLTHWVPVARREKEHHWTGETTVVRVAREAGFLFHDGLEDLWHEDRPFVLAFQKPSSPLPTAADPDLPPPLPTAALAHTLLNLRATNGAIVFVGLDRGRALLPLLNERRPLQTRLFDVTLDEWALSREELPPEGQLAGTEIVRTEQGRLALPADIRVGLVVFADAYHRLWAPVPLLTRLQSNLTDDALIAIVERDGPGTASRRLANHRRRLSAHQATAELHQAGFALRQTLTAPTEDRYFLLFGRKAISDR